MWFHVQLVRKILSSVYDKNDFRLYNNSKVISGPRNTYKNRVLVFGFDVIVVVLGRSDYTPTKDCPHLI